MRNKYLFTLLFILSCWISAFSQQQPLKHNHKHKHSKKQVDLAPISPGPKVTNNNNTGSSDGTMPDNNDPGKVTTSTKGKNGPSNSSTMQMKPAHGKGGPAKMYK